MSELQSRKNSFCKKCKKHGNYMIYMGYVNKNSESGKIPNSDKISETWKCLYCDNITFVEYTVDPNRYEV